VPDAPSPPDPKSKQRPNVAISNVSRPLMQLLERAGRVRVLHVRMLCMYLCASVSRAVHSQYSLSCRYSDSDRLVALLRHARSRLAVSAHTRDRPLNTHCVRVRVACASLSEHAYITAHTLRSFCLGQAQRLQAKLCAQRVHLLLFCQLALRRVRVDACGR
jgi:hypothetical protein